MFEAATMLYLYVETPLHVGSGRSLGAVDLPIQREVTTGYPMVQASSLKGRLRAEARPPRMEAAEFKAIFGPETGNASDHAGALAPGDARLLLFPLRSLAGVFAWATSRDVLARFQRDAAMVGLRPDWGLPLEPGRAEALVQDKATLVAGGRVVLEEFAFQPVESPAVGEIGRWLATHCLPETEEYRYWREGLPGRLVLLPSDPFRDFTRLSTEVATRIKLDLDTKTVEEGALWTEESLPADSLLWAPLMASPSRVPNGDRLAGAEVLRRVAALGSGRRQMGGDETVGRGVVFLRFGLTGGAR